MKNKDINKKNKIYAKQNNEAEEKQPTLDHIEKKFHQPNRPSV